MGDSLSDSLKRVEALMPSCTAAPEEAGSASSSLEALRKTIEDRTLDFDTRIAALHAFSDRFPIEPAFADTILALLDESDSGILEQAIAAAPPFDGRVMTRLRAFLADPRPKIWEAAAVALARKKDREILPRMLAWARNGDASHRRVGFAAIAFLLIPEDHLAEVESICEYGPRDDEDEAILVEALRVADARVAFWRRHAKPPVE